MEITKTCRGFARINFHDRYGVQCSLQKSSLATDDAIWLGCNDANPRELVQGKGWTLIPMPADYIADTRMHLTREQVAALLPHLHSFVETGDLALHATSIPATANFPHGSMGEEVEGGS